MKACEMKIVSDIVGYHNYFRMDVSAAVKAVEKKLPDGWVAAYLEPWDEAPNDWHRVGQVCVHHGDPSFILAVHKKNQAAAAIGSIRTPKKAAASRENGKKGGRPAEPRYTLTTSTNTWTDLTMRDLVRIVLKKWPDHEWPDDDKEFLAELNSLDPQGIRAEEMGK